MKKLLLLSLSALLVSCAAEISDRPVVYYPAVDPIWVEEDYPIVYDRYVHEPRGRFHEGPHPRGHFHR